jgi:hypothetical protein
VPLSKKHLNPETISQKLRHLQMRVEIGDTPGCVYVPKLGERHLVQEGHLFS